MNRVRASVVVLIAAGLVAACSGQGGSATTPGTALPASSWQNASSTSLPYAGAPKVPNPLPASVLSGDPCADALTAQQVVTAIGVDVAGQREDLPQLGPACAWTNRETRGAVGVGYTLNTHVGLSGVYANTKPKSALWRELPSIQGFPAVAYADSKGGQGPVDFCQASVGLADSFSIDVSLTLGVSKKNTEGACGLISQVADMAVTTLRAKAGS